MSEWGNETTAVARSGMRPTARVGKLADRFPADPMRIACLRSPDGPVLAGAEAAGSASGAVPRKGVG
jgi:hypothetical protein